LDEANEMSRDTPSRGGELIEAESLVLRSRRDGAEATGRQGVRDNADVQ